MHMTEAQVQEITRQNKLQAYTILENSVNGFSASVNEAGVMDQSFYAHCLKQYNDAVTYLEDLLVDRQRGLIDDLTWTQARVYVVYYGITLYSFPPVEDRDEFCSAVKPLAFVPVERG